MLDEAMKTQKSLALFTQKQQQIRFVMWIVEMSLRYDKKPEQILKLVKKTLKLMIKD